MEREMYKRINHLLEVFINDTSKLCKLCHQFKHTPDCELVQVAEKLRIKKFKVVWRGDSEPTIMEGGNIEEAFSNAGYGGGAITAINYYEEIK